MKQLWILIISLSLAVSAAGNPQIQELSGAMVHGNQLVISGAGFGTKSPAKPYLWAPFDNGSNPSSLGRVTSWDALNNMTWNASEGIGGGGCLKASNGSGNWTAMVDATGFAWNDYGQQMYIFQKGKRNFPFLNLDQWSEPLNQSNFQDWPTINWKSWRLWDAGLTHYSFLGASNGNFRTQAPYNISSNCYGSATAMHMAPNSWYTMEFVIRSNTSATSGVGVHGDGYFGHFVNGVKAAEAPYQAWDGTRYWKMRDVSSNSFTRNYVVHAVKANATFPSHWRYWADDIYVDNTWARVMIGNASTLAASTRREPLIPVTWSASAVSVSVNRGAFVEGEPVYVFVVNAAGQVSPGFGPIPIGSVIGGDPPPGAPIGVTLQQQ